jgi:hypothetical protein
MVTTRATLATSRPIDRAGSAELLESKAGVADIGPA